MQPKIFQTYRGCNLTIRFAGSLLVCLMSICGCYSNSIFSPSQKPTVSSSLLAKIISLEEQATQSDDPIVGRVKSIEFAGLSGRGLSAPDLLQIPVELILESTPAGDTYRALSPNQPTVTIRLCDLVQTTGDKTDVMGSQFSASALKAILEAISREYQRRRIAAVRVNITRSAIERLRKSDGDGVLTIQIREGTVAQVRVLPAKPKLQNKANLPRFEAKNGGKGVETGGNKANLEGVSPRFVGAGAGNFGGKGEKGVKGVKGETSETGGDRLAARIRRLSAVQRGGLIKLDELDRYIAHLNRHPGRQVDAALSPGPRDGELTLDYLVTETKQPLFYGQISNTGTEQTSRCREQFGMIHHNLTRSDDILYVDYITGNFDSVHGVSGGYERPVGDWTRLRAKVFGSWREYEASEVGLAGQSFRGENYSVGGELAWNFFQHKSFFVDAVGGIQHHRVKTKNGLAGVEGKSNFLLPYIGLRAEQRTEKSNLFASLIGEFNIPCLVDTDDRGLNGLDRLGRGKTDRQWFTLRYALSGSFFLEPILDAKWKEPDHPSTLAHELFTSVRGQVTLHDRRVPANYMQTAGGFHTVRGYPESFSAGDNAFSGTLEYRYHWPRSLKPKAQVGKIFGKDFRWQPEHRLGPTDWDLILRGFFDAGYTCKNEKLSYENDLALISSGLGVELLLRNNVRIRADWGWPLRGADNGEDDVEVGGCRVHLSLSVVY